MAFTYDGQAVGQMSDEALLRRYDELLRAKQGQEEMTSPVEIDELLDIVASEVVFRRLRSVEGYEDEECPSDEIPF